MVYSKCDSCGKEEALKVMPIGAALLPEEWLQATRNGKTVDVCSPSCATAIDKKDGRETTTVVDVDADGQLTLTNVDHADVVN